LTDRDPLAVGLGALICGVAFGAACVTVAVIVVTLAGAFDARGDALIAGLAFGILVAAVSGWRLAGPLDNTWQRGVVCVLSVFGALMLGFILTIPARQVFGLGGLAILALVLIATGSAGGRWSARGRGTRQEEGNA
jgi:hypothetical protein